MSLILNARQLRWLRSELGAATAEPDLQELYEQIGTVRDVALHVLRERRAALLASPMSVNVSGVASISTAENVKALERQIASLAVLDADPSDDADDPDAVEGPPLRSVPLTRTRRR